MPLRRRAALIPLGAFDYKGSFTFLGVRDWLYFVSMMTFNAVLHIRATIQAKRYPPGVISSMAFYLPLAVIGSWYFLKSGAVDIFSALVCCAAGSLLQLVVNHIHERHAASTPGTQPCLEEDANRV